MSFPLRPAAIRVTAAALSFVAVTAPASSAVAALDLTGTWSGTWKCKDVTNGVLSRTVNTLTMTVTQSGSNVYAVLAWVGRGSPSSFHGHVDELTDDPGRGTTTLIACGTTDTSSGYVESLSANVKTSASGATFKAISTYEQANVPTVGGTCKYTLKRTTTADPGVAACPVTAVCGNGVIEGGEQCDVGNLDGASCVTQGFAGGTLRCATGCAFDVSGCYTTRFVDNGDGTVTDNQTKLQWEKKSGTCNAGANAGALCMAASECPGGTCSGSESCSGACSCSGTHCVRSTYAWCLDADDDGVCDNSGIPDGTVFTDFLHDLNCASPDGNTLTGGFAGHCDWRIPTSAELQTILLAPFPCGTAPCIDPVFGPTIEQSYWSSTPGPSPNPSYPWNYAWIVSFSDGALGKIPKGTAGHVRAVRGGS